DFGGRQTWMQNNRNWELGTGNWERESSAHSLPNSQFPIANSQLRGQLFLGLDLDDPEAAVRIGDVNVAVAVDRTPGAGNVGDVALRIAGGDVPDFSALVKQIAPKLAGDVEDPQSALIITEEQGVTRDPDVVRAAVLRLEIGDCFRIGDVGDV